MERRLIKQIRIGWTGPIACGKSTLAEAVIAEGKTRGLTVHNVDLDKISHDVLFCRQEPAYGLLRSRLQKALRLEEWSRKAVGHKVFNDSAARELLNNAVEPALRTRLRQELADKEGIVLINGALLVEAGWSRVCNNQVVIVTADLLTQLERLKARGHNEEEAIRRVKAQATGEQKAQLLADQFRKDNFGKWAQFTGMGDIPEKAKQILDEIITWG